MVGTCSVAFMLEVKWWSLLHAAITTHSVSSLGLVGHPRSYRWWYTGAGLEEWRRPSIRQGRTCAGDWSCSGSKQLGGTRPAPAYHHPVHARELAHPAQPDNLE